MKAVRMLKTEKGFSLIELMIVVAIIGILATVAIPNFSRFQAKARASEARAQLSALYTSQRAFQAEWNGYHSDLVQVGYRPNGILRYVVGHGAAAAFNIPGYTGPTLTAANFNTGVAAVCDQPPATVPGATGCLNGAQNNAGTGLTSAAIPNTQTVTLAAFSAQAAGFVGGTTTDVWQINQNRAVNNVTPGGF